MMHWGKKALAALLSVAMTVTLLPIGGMSVEAAEAKAPVLHYDMSHADGKLTDVSGNGYDGTLQGITDSDFITEGESTILNFDGSEKYVEIPSGSITNEKFTIETTYSDSTKSNAWLFTLGSIRGAWPNVKNYLFVSPVSSDKDYDGKLLAAIKDETEHRIPTSKFLTSDTTKDNVVTVVFNYGDVTYYLNGEASDVTETDISILDLLGAGSTEECMGYIGRSLYTPDSNYKGTVRDFKIYNYAMTQEEVVSSYEAASVEIMKNSVLKSAQETMLNGNDPSEVISDLVFPSEIEGVSLNWTSSDTTAIDATGKYVYEGEESKEVTISVTGTKDNAEFLKKTWKITVTNKLFVDMNALTIPNMDNIKGNITLPTTGKTGSSITWTSDKPEVISVTETENQGYDKTPAGVVTRQATDTKVKLTATITTEDQKSKTKDFNVTVKAKTKTEELTDYVFAYFIGDGAGQEKIFLATSQDGLNWEEINDAEPFLESDLGEKGLRDPYIFRSAEGDKFYLIATDLQIAAGNGWTVAQQAGSQAIMVWESEDLVHWSEQRMVTVSAGIEAGCTWAPEVFYDDKTGEYIVFWASKIKSNNYDRQRLYYCKTRDFYTFTEPKLWIEKDFSVIDTTVVRDDNGTYYRFTKNEDGDAKYIFLEKSQSMLGEWESISSTSLESEKWVEGPCCFRFNDDDIEKAGGKWGVLLDDFGGIGYYPMITSDLATAEFTKLTTANLPKIKKPRHGTVMRITSAEYDALMEAYGVKINDNIPAVVTTESGYTLPKEINVSIGRKDKKVAVTWDVAEDTFKKAGTVKATATIPELNNQTVSVTIEVISAKLIYYIDSGVGEWNENLKESGSYNKVAELLTLRNNKPDQLYTAGSWGFVNDSSNSIAGNRTSTTDSIYANGWWAKEDKECEYILPLESGTYTATGYFGEWWSTTRPMKFCVKYTDDNNKEVTQEVAVTVSSSASQQTVSLNFKVENVAETAEVHFSSVKTGTADPVIAGLSVEKVADGKVDAEITKGWEQITVPGTKTIQEGNTEEIAVNYPKGFLDNISKSGLTISKALTSSDTEVVDVTKDGKITAKLAGTADITTKITLSDQRTKEFTTKVTVTAKPNEKDTAIAAVNKDWDKMTVSPASKTMQVGNTELIIVNYPGGLLDNISKAGLTISKTYTSSNTKVAEVAQTGKITAKTAGTANITTKITLSNQKTKSFITKVTVKAKPSTEIPVKTLKLNKTKLTLELKKTYKLKATVTPSNATNKKVSWKSSDSKIVAVSNGKLTAKKVGSANIAVATSNGKIAICKVTVKIGVKKVTLNKKKVTLGVKETFTLKTTITPKNATNKKVKWTSDKKNIATVNSKGVVTAKKAGKAKITATVDGKKVSCTVTVKKAPSKITLNKKSVSLKKNKTFQIKVKFPKNTTSNKITYKSSKPKIVSVTSAGKVKALKKGSATITVQTFNKKKATLKVTVK